MALYELRSSKTDGEDLDKETQTLTRMPEFSAPKRGSSNRQKPNTC